MKNNLEKWLRQPIDENKEVFIGSKYSNIYMGRHDPAKYPIYFDGNNDIDIKMNDEAIVGIVKFNETDIKNSKDKELIQMHNSCEKYGDKMIVFPRNTNRAHANYLFKRMIDLIHLNYLGLSIDPENDSKIAIVDTSMKQSFYEFCMQYST
jgi:aspartate/glutamate racemase